MYQNFASNNAQNCARREALPNEPANCRKTGARNSKTEKSPGNVRPSMAPRFAPEPADVPLGLLGRS
eukprot:463666-Rhodomonas_salina.1